MADQTYELNEEGAPMDYPQHEQTYSMFLLLTKWGILFNVALLLAMAVGFFLSLYWMTKKSSPGSNKYGPNPLDGPVTDQLKEVFE